MRGEHGVHISGELITSRHLQAPTVELKWMTIASLREHTKPKEKEHRGSILSVLDNRSVVSFTYNPETGYVEVSEECDQYYTEHLDKAEMAQLITELQEIHGRMA